MYSIAEQDSVHLLEDVPQPSLTMPSREIYATSDRLVLAYHVQDPREDYTEGAAHELGPVRIGLPVALITFKEPCAHILCPPAAEVLSRHPLAERGLEPFGVYEVQGSSWLRELQRLSPAYRADRIAVSKHFVFTFYEEVFECVAAKFDCILRFGSVTEVLRAGLRESDKNESYAE